MTQDITSLAVQLEPLGLEDWRYYPVVTSTNDLALTWAAEGARDNSLVIADTQTAGRGRSNRQWVTHPGAALAFSLILRPTEDEIACLPRFTALAALSLLAALDQFDLKGSLKWPNDVLLAGKKTAGVLVEAEWQVDRLAALVVGMGVNVTPEAVPPAADLRYPATSIESELGETVDRWALLASILHTLMHYRDRLTAPDFIRLWNDRLAFRGEKVNFRFPDGSVRSLTVTGVQSDGRLILETPQGETLHVVAGEIELAGRDNGS
ncbi:MAG TPA: biotin--[acetyl-CoA-carboxylase] ligase [Anaerolineaceae bacterium]|nr:biotin--[acetyl-CoA-carboxylase] ligase [Anaerolineaceae bacterium]